MSKPRLPPGPDRQVGGRLAADLCSKSDGTRKALKIGHALFGIFKTRIFVIEDLLIKAEDE